MIVVGGHGGRLDHFLANALLLCSSTVASMRIAAFVGQATLTVIHDCAELLGSRGDLVSLLPIGGPALGVATVGLLYPLDKEPLHPGTTRGVSNEFALPAATVRVEAGTVLAVQPGVAGTHFVRRAFVDEREQRGE